jgi:creatinine amidohydrolase
MDSSALERLQWCSRPAEAFREVDPRHTVAILPIAATEQHGPHLPLSTDSAIMQGMLETVAPMVPPEMDVRILPVQKVGKSDEHIFAPGTLSLSAELFSAVLLEIGSAVSRAGIRKLIIVNSHGGNVEVMGIVARTLRIRHNMLVAKSSWMSFGFPTDLYSEEEWRNGIHGGDVETSLMLHFRPELVDMSKADHFVSSAMIAERDLALLRPTGAHAFAWIASDLNPSGAIGNAAIATAEKGRQTAEHQARGFATLVADVERADLEIFLPGAD